MTANCGKNKNFETVHIHVSSNNNNNQGNDEDDGNNNGEETNSVLSCKDLLISSFHRSANMWIFIYLKSSFTWMFIWTQFIEIFFRSYLQLLVSVVFLAARIS